MLPCAYGIAVLFHSEALLAILGGGTLLIILSCVILSITFGCYSRKSGAWALVGIVTSIVALFLAPLLCTGFFLLA